MRHIDLLHLLILQARQCPQSRHEGRLYGHMATLPSNRMNDVFLFYAVWGHVSSSAAATAVSSSSTAMNNLSRGDTFCCVLRALTHPQTTTQDRMRRHHRQQQKFIFINFFFFFPINSKPIHPPPAAASVSLALSPLVSCLVLRAKVKTAALQLHSSWSSM